MCIGVCIDLFFDINLFNKINLLILFIDSYYRTTFSRKIIKLLLQCFALFSTNVHFARCGCDKIEATDDQYICFNELNNAKWELCKTCNRRSSPFCERRF